MLNVGVDELTEKLLLVVEDTRQLEQDRRSA